MTKQPCGTCGSIELNPKCGVCRSLYALKNERDSVDKSKPADKKGKRVPSKSAR